MPRLFVWSDTGIPEPTLIVYNLITVNTTAMVALRYFC